MLKIIAKAVAIATMATTINTFSSPSQGPLRSAMPKKMTLAVIARVGDEIITNFDLSQETWATERRLMAQFKGKKLTAKEANFLQKRVTELRKRTLENMITNQLVLQEFKKMKFTIPETLVQSRLNDMIQSKTAGKREAFEAALQAEGKTLNEYKKKIRESIAVEMLFSNKVRQDVEVTDKEVFTFYQQNLDKFKTVSRKLLELIHLKSIGKNSDGPEKTSEIIIDKLANGANFATLAQQYSDAKNCNLGWMEERKLNKAFLTALKGIKKGETTKPFSIGNDICLLHIIDEQKAGTLDLNNATQTAIKRKLREQKMAKRHDAYTKKLHGKYFVKKYITEADDK